MAAARCRIIGAVIGALRRNLNRPPLDEMMRNNVFFDTCVYHQPGIDLLHQAFRR